MILAISFYKLDCVLESRHCFHLSLFVFIIFLDFFRFYCDFRSFFVFFFIFLYFYIFLFLRFFNRFSLFTSFYHHLYLRQFHKIQKMKLSRQISIWFWVDFIIIECYFKLYLRSFLPIYQIILAPNVVSNRNNDSCLWFFVQTWKIWTNMNVITDNIYPDRDNFEIVSKPMFFKWFLVKLSRKITSSIYLFNISMRFTFIIHSNFAINLWKPFLCSLAIPYQLVDWIHWITKQWGCIKRNICKRDVLEK